MSSAAKIGLQLYTVRDVGEKNYMDMLREVKKLGYDYVELAGYDAYSAADVKAMLEEAGLTALSAHYSLDNYVDMEKTVSYHAAIGLKYIAVPWMAREKNPGGELFDATLPMLKDAAAKLKAAGIQLLYHNHDFEFELVDGVPALDKLFEAIPEMLPEFDTCWVKYAGYDPVKYINKYSGKTPVIHLKDFVGAKSDAPVYALMDKDGKAEGGNKEVKTFAFRPVGHGVQDVPGIVRAGLASGAEAFIVEQDECYGDTLAAAKASLDYLKSIGL